MLPSEEFSLKFRRELRSGGILTASIAEDWGLSFSDLVFLADLPGDMQLEVALQISHLLRTGRFIEDWSDLAGDVVSYVASQIERPADRPTSLFDDRRSRRYRIRVGEYLGFSRPEQRDLADFDAWLMTDVVQRGGSVSKMTDLGGRWFLDRKLVSPSEQAVGRIVRSARQRFLDRYMASVAARLSRSTTSALEASLVDPRGSSEFQRLKGDVGAATLANVLDAANRLAFIRKLDLPYDMIGKVDPSWVKLLVRRAEGETASDMRRHSREKRLGLLAVYLMTRRTELLDGLVDLLLEIVHRIGARSKRKVIGKIATDIEKVHGKERLLVDIATAAMMAPNGRVVDVIFPVAGAAKLKAIVDEDEAKGTLDVQIQTVMRGSYASHYRRMLPSLLSVLRFRSNNEIWKPIIDALSLIAELNVDGRRYVPASLAPEGSIPRKWQGTVIDNLGRLNVISYELCVLTQLRDRVRAKEIWIEGADRYRNPDDDLPNDFPERRNAYYAELNLTQDAHAFSNTVRGQLEQELRQLNATLPNNDKVRLRCSGENRICVTPFDPASEPKGLAGLKVEIGRRWPMTGLLDTLKETALYTGFLDVFETSATREALSREVRDQRLLLSLYGLGTNVGLKRIAAGTPRFSHDELLHIRRRYIDPTSLRTAVMRVADATFAIRNPTIWGEAGTACASDSTKFGAWDRNLMTEWHARYGGRGVMIYWHVER